MSVFSDLYADLLPRRAVELGVGDGASAAAIMKVVERVGPSTYPYDNPALTAVNWPNPPSGDDPGRYLLWYLGDPRLRLIFGDTRDPEVVAQVPDGIEMLHIDSTHTRECAEEEWRLYESKLADEATVVVDDLDHNDMLAFWANLIADVRVVRADIVDNRVGVMRYKRC